MKLRAFGIELRKIDNVRAVYEDVDLVLARSGVTALSPGAEVQTQAVAHALHKMLSVDNWFCICTVDVRGTRCTGPHTACTTRTCCRSIDRRSSRCYSMTSGAS